MYIRICLVHTVGILINLRKCSIMLLQIMLLKVIVWRDNIIREYKLYHVINETYYASKIN